MDPTDTLDRTATATDWLPPGWHLRYDASVGSTQDEARAAAVAGAPERTLFVTDHQELGRGRQGRRWTAPPGSALLLSVLFRGTGAARRPWYFTSLASLALTDAITRVAPTAQPTIKWPNDVMLGERKVAGVLAESSWNGQHLAIVVGVGVNVAMNARQLAEVGPNATSLCEEVGHDVDRGDLLKAFVGQMHNWLDTSDGELQATWQARLWGRGQRVRVRGLEKGFANDPEMEVVVLGTEPDGALRVRLADGREECTYTAEILP